MVENPDIIESVVTSAHEVVVVGFAAETQDTLNYAREKRQRKGLHAIVVNDVSDTSIGFNSPNNATFICDNEEVFFERQSKKQMATQLLQQIAKTLGNELTIRKPLTGTDFNHAKNGFPQYPWILWNWTLAFFAPMTFVALPAPTLQNRFVTGSVEPSLLKPSANPSTKRPSAAMGAYRVQGLNKR